MRLLTRQEISKEFRMPLASVVSRMADLGVCPFAPPKNGRGHHVLYDANEIIMALKNERERKRLSAWRGILLRLHPGEVGYGTA